MNVFTPRPEFNARDMNPQDVADTFVFTETFWAATERGNHVLIGSRGSGKTAIARMLCHDHLARSKDAKARRAIAERRFVGIYVHTQLEWVGALTNRVWTSPDDAERLFIYRFNLEACLAFLRTIRSCLTTYYPERQERNSREDRIVEELTSAWFGSAAPAIDIDDLERRLWNVVSQQNREDNRAQIRGIAPVAIPDAESFHFDILRPLRDALRRIAPLLGFTDMTVWALCIDEAEFLDEPYMRILNSAIRAGNGDLFLKITTTPYHYTLKTNLSTPIAEGNDFSYLYIDRDPQFEARKAHSQENGLGFAETMFERRYADLGTLTELLGHSTFLLPATSDWGPKSELRVLLERYGSEETRDRARGLSGSRFSNEIGRKIEPLLRLRRAAERGASPAPQLFTGVEMMVRCSDVNPRKLVRLFRALSTAVQNGSRVENEPIQPTVQASLLKQFAEDTFGMVVAEPKVGPLTFELLNALGTALQRRFYNSPVTTDPIFSVEISTATDEGVVEAVHNAVGLGAMYPHPDTRDWYHHPSGFGKFRLAYALAPYFGLLPRLGDSREVVDLTSMERIASGPLTSRGRLRQRILGQSPLPGVLDDVPGPPRVLESELRMIRNAMIHGDEASESLGDRE